MSKTYDTTLSTYQQMQLAAFGYAHLAGAGTTLLKTGAGVLNGVSVNTKGTVASAVKLYDGLDATGTLIASIDSLNLSGFFEMGPVAFTVGLCVVLTDSAGPDVTVSFA